MGIHNHFQTFLSVLGKKKWRSKIANNKAYDDEIIKFQKDMK